MPGGYTSRDGYQAVDEEANVQTPKAPTSQGHNTAPVGQPTAPDAYQSVV